MIACIAALAATCVTGWAQTPAPPALPTPSFPAAAARAYLAAAAPPIPSLAEASPLSSPAAALRAEGQLRRLATSTRAGTTAQRQRALAAFVLGVGEGERGNLAAAQADLALAAQWAPVRDAATASLTALLDQNKDAAGTLAAATQYPLARTDVFYREIAMRAAQSAATLQQWPQVLSWTDGLALGASVIWLRAQADAATGQPQAAAALDRDLVYRFPTSSQAALAAAAWQQYLAAYPNLAPDWHLLRTQALALSAARSFRPAVASWTAAAALAPADERPAMQASQARALAAVGDNDQATALVSALLPTSERAQALELQIELARARKDAAGMNGIEASLATLASEFPTSRWYAEGLHEAADQALLDGDALRMQALFDRLTAAFPDSVYAPEARWQADWAAYRLGQAEAPQRLETYLLHYPKGTEAPDALYWRGAWAQAHQEPGLAQACFQAEAQHFPGTYFGQQARQREAATVDAAKVMPHPEWLLPYLTPAPTPRPVAVAASLQPELQRAAWLRDAGLLDPAAAILQGVFQPTEPSAGPPSLALARSLAALDDQRGAWHAGMAAMMRALPNYLELRPRQLPESDWKLLFPLPYAAEMAAVSEHSGVERDLLLGVARQESGFDPKSVSSARARGLMQLELATARGGFPRLPPQWQALAVSGRGAALQAQDLLNPSLNLALGAAQLRSLFDRFQRPEYALAGYNAGASRAAQWQREFPALDRDEFIESIPFAQTRAYVQAVLRNQAHYAAIYGK